LMQHATNTTIVKNKLPEKLEELDEIAQKEAKRLESDLKKQLVFDEMKRLKFEVPTEKIINNYEDTHAYKSMSIEKKLQGLHRFLQINLSVKHSHLRDTFVDYGSRVEAFWMRNGFLPDERMVAKRKGQKKMQEDKHIPKDKVDLMTDEKVWRLNDHCFQIQGSHTVHMRSKAMFDSYVDINDEICQSGDVPKWNYNPKFSGFTNYNQIGTNIPGTWTDASNPYVNLSYTSSLNKSENLTSQTAWQNSEYGQIEDMMDSKAIMSAFGILLPTACYMGFDPMNDPTRPLATNVVVSDGQFFKLASYQLNKTELVDAGTNEKESIEKYPRNVMWSLDEQPLYDEIDTTSRQVKGLNLEVLANLIKFYLLKPTVREKDIENTEYLSPKKYIHNLNDTYNRNYAWRSHRHIYSKRPRHLEKPDVEMWEKIYRLRHPDQTFPMGFRELPWYEMAKHDHMGKKHWHPEFREMDYYIPAYQPSKFRPEGQKKKRGYNRVKKVFPPIPDTDDPPGYGYKDPWSPGFEGGRYRR